MGRLELVTLQDLRDRVGALDASATQPRPSRFETVTGDVRELHRKLDYAGALFQVASQFNLLEMIGPQVSPEEGVARYADDRTQGPACAMAAGAAVVATDVGGCPELVTSGEHGLLVAPGDDVRPRQGIVVMEAMKMECELGAPGRGRVREILVEPGASVEAGRLLAVVE